MFSPGVAYNRVNNTWALFYAGASTAGGAVSIGAAMATNPDGPFVRAHGASQAITAGSGAGGGATKFVAEPAMAIPAGSDLFSANTTVAQAEARCAASMLCRGFTFNPPPNVSK